MGHTNSFANPDHAPAQDSSVQRLNIRHIRIWSGLSILRSDLEQTDQNDE